MGSVKWITGLLGWVSGGPIGAIIGFIFGSVVDMGADAVKMLTGGQPQDGQGPWQRQSGEWQGQTYQRPYRTGAGGYSATEQRNSFMVSLLVLSSAVVRADGKTLQSELDYVRSFIRANFGDQAVDEAMRILDGLGHKEINIYLVGSQIAANMNYSQRLQLFHYLADLANADGEFCKAEKSVLESISAAIRLNADDAASVIAMFYKDNASAYTVLEISPSATDDEVKTAYRRMAMKYHPDKVASLGEDVRKSAEEKFRKIQEAYESIKKERGMN